MKALALILVFALGEEAEFYRGTNLERDGKDAEAAEVFRALVERAPADPFADDALLELGRLEEEKLGDPAAALAAYERLTKDYPDSRLAVRAQRRAEALRALVGPGGAQVEAARAWGAIFYGFAGRSRADTIAAVEAFLAGHPDFAGAPRATYWLATLLRDQGRPDDALARLGEVARRWPGTEWAPRAERTAGEILVARGELDAAEAAYRAAGSDDGLARVGRERWRARAAILSWLVIAGALLGGLAATWRAAGSLRPLLRPPGELLFLLPVAAIFVGASLTENRALGHAVMMIAAGGLVTAWLSGAALEAARGRGPIRFRRAAAHIVVAVTAMLAVCYISVTRERLIDELVETIRFGADR